MSSYQVRFLSHIFHSQMSDDSDCFTYTSGPFFISDPAGNMVPKGTVTAKLVKDDDFIFLFQLYHGDSLLVSQQLDSSLDLYFKGEKTLEWVFRRADGQLQHLRLVCEENTKAFKFAMSQALLEVTTGKTLESIVDEGDKEWVLGMHIQSHSDEPVDVDFDMDEGGHCAMTDDDEFEDCQAPVTAAPTAPTYKDLNPSDDEEEEEDEPERGAIRSSSYNTPRRPTKARSAPKSGRKNISVNVGAEANSLLVSGKAENRSFVVRNDQIGVFKYTDDGDLAYQNKLRKIKAQTGETIHADLVQLHSLDKQLLLVDKDDKSKVHQVDLETGKVIDTWMGDDHVKFESLAPKTKYAQTTAEEMVVGTSTTGLFSIDPRINTKNKMADQFFYKDKNVGLQSITTTGSGYVAVASNKGDIRLFNKIGKGYCKTQLPGLGNPILHIDTTEDGTWLVATCKTYLLVFPLITSAGKTGFEARMGSEKPMPLKLTITPEDQVKYNITDISFTPAKFNTGTLANSYEQWIATSCGNWVITWDFEKVKKGQRNAYKFKNTTAEVVSDVFRHNNMNELVVAHTDDVFMSRIKKNK